MSSTYLKKKHDYNNFAATCKGRPLWYHVFFSQNDALIVWPGPNWNFSASQTLAFSLWGYLPSVHVYGTSPAPITVPTDELGWFVCK